MLRCVYISKRTYEAGRRVEEVGVLTRSGLSFTLPNPNRPVFELHLVGLHRFVGWWGLDASIPDVKHGTVQRALQLIIPFEAALGKWILGMSAPVGDGKDLTVCPDEAHAVAGAQLHSQEAPFAQAGFLSYSLEFHSVCKYRYR